MTPISPAAAAYGGLIDVFDRSCGVDDLRDTIEAPLKAPGGAPARGGNGDH